MTTANSVTIRIRYTFDYAHWTEETVTVERARVIATFVNGFSGSFWFWMDTQQEWWESNI